MSPEVSPVRIPSYWHHIFLILAVIFEGHTRSVGDSSQPWFRRLSALSLQDLIALHIPYMVTALIVVIGACFINEHTMQLRPYSAVPDKIRNWIAFMICFMEEMRFLIMIPGTAGPAWQLQVISFGLIERNLKFMGESLSVSYNNVSAFYFQFLLQCSTKVASFFRNYSSRRRSTIEVQR